MKKISWMQLWIRIKKISDPNADEDPLITSIIEKQDSNPESISSFLRRRLNHKRNSQPGSPTSFLRRQKDITTNVHRLPLQCA
ncbi:hypothetical protein NPIL_505881 [Nephila pilipes]|uniref:Uncharacterized protein n=1 Tax=Nephila pilipes TaxID=299642 RepID=A0A8X6UU84_NEPPI|nr:hypothetical protein NPIL_505881 [Nephila pilipes]